jgi:cellulose synthase/poly-beta-1,6-N-acetylglucosamine synthase-like glycosyltransferase
MGMISTLIPVFRESDLLETLLNQLIKDPYKNKEIITVIDEPTKNSLKTVKKYKNQVKFVLNKERKGKANALSEAAKTAKGDVFLFLDGDTIISKKAKDFLKKVEENIKDVDLLEFKKRAFGENLLSRLMNYDYVADGVRSILFNQIDTCLGINGAGFAIKKEFFNEVGGFKKVILEDVEMGIQVHLYKKKYKFVKDITIYQRSPQTFKVWLHQRKRYSIGALHFLKTHYKDVFKVMLTHPKSSLIILFYFYPTLLSLFLMSPFIERTILLVFFLLSLKIPIIMPFLFIASWGLLLFKNATVFLIMYGITSTLFYIASKKLQLDYRNRYFLIYYLFYSPFFLVLFTYYFWTNFFKEEQALLNDWKV